MMTQSFYCEFLRFVHETKLNSELTSGPSMKTNHNAQIILTNYTFDKYERVQHNHRQIIDFRNASLKTISIYVNSWLTAWLVCCGQC